MPDRTIITSLMRHILAADSTTDVSTWVFDESILTRSSVLTGARIDTIRAAALAGQDIPTENAVRSAIDTVVMDVISSVQDDDFIISHVTGLQTALDSKLDRTQLMGSTTETVSNTTKIASTGFVIQSLDGFQADLGLTAPTAVADRTYEILGNSSGFSVIQSTYNEQLEDKLDITNISPASGQTVTSTTGVPSLNRLNQEIDALEFALDARLDVLELAEDADTDLSNITAAGEAVIVALVPSTTPITNRLDTLEAADDANTNLSNITPAGEAVIDARIAVVPPPATDISGKVDITQIYTDTSDGTGGSLTDEIPTKGYVDTHITKATAGGTMERDSLLLDSAPVTINLIDASQIIGGRLVFPYDSAEPNASVGDKLILDGITTTEYIITTKQLFGAHSWEFFTSGGFGADRIEAITVQAIEVPAGASFESLRVVGDTVSTSIIGTDLTIDTTGIDRDIERSRVKFEKAGPSFEAFGADIMHSHSGNTVDDREMLLLSFAENDQAQAFADLIDADPNYAIGIDGGDYANVVGTQVNIIPGSNNTLIVYFGEPFIVNNGDELGKVTTNEVDIARIRIGSTFVEFEEADGTTNTFTPTGGDGGGTTAAPLRYVEILAGAPAPTAFTGTLPAGFTSGLNYVYLTVTYNRFFSATGESLREGTTVIFSKEYV